MVRPYTWFLDRAGTEGIALTSAGYLPPADVEALAAELNLADEWYGKLNREAQTLSEPRHGPDPEQPTCDGATFARAALRTWH